MATPRGTPEIVKRQLRQEAGFGCCRCGHPFIEYHHIIPFAEDAHFRPEDMMVLCASCHHLCTTGAMLESHQRALKARPKNIVDNALRGQLWVNATELRVEFAGGVAINTPQLLQIGASRVLGARLSDDGRVLISAQVHDPNGVEIATLTDNEWSLSPSDVWDFEVRPQQAIVRSAARQVSFNVDCRNDRLQVSGIWHWRGKRVAFTPHQALIGTSTLTIGEIAYCSCAIAVR